MKWPDRNEAIRLFEQRAVRSNTEDDCWIWFGSINNAGYGTISCKGVPLKAHRVSWWLYKGDIPEGMHVLHKCDIRDCVNPKHLFLGTHQDNMDDKREKGRCRNQYTTGGRLPRLTKYSIYLIQTMRNDPLKPTYEELAYLFQVSIPTIHRAIFYSE